MKDYAVINHGPWPEQLLTCSDPTKQKGIANCTMCPAFHSIDSVNDWDVLHNFCRHMGGVMKDPEICWCKTGLFMIWMTKAKPDEVVEALNKIVEGNSYGQN